MAKKIQDVSDAVIVIDETGTMVKVNPAAAALFGYEEEELLSRPIIELLPPSGQNWSDRDGLVFELLKGRVESLYKKGVKKNGLSFPVDVFIVPFKKDGRQFYDCVIKDDSARFFHERLEALANVILRRVLIGENLENVAPFIVEQLATVFPFPLLWVGRYEREEKGVVVLSSWGPLASMAPKGTLYTHQEDIVHPAVYACERMEVQSDDVHDEDGGLYKMMAFPFLSKKNVSGVLTVLAPVEYLNHVQLNRLENIALRLGMILQIAEDQNALRLLGTAISSAMNAVFITDAHGKIIWANEAFARLSGYTLEQVIGRMPDFLYSGNQPPDFYQRMWRTIKSGRCWRAEVIDRKKDGSLMTIEQMITPILDKEGRVKNYVVVNDDLTARRTAEGKVLHLSNYDQLTGLPNRSLFHEKLRQAVVRAARRNEIFAILFLDLSGFNRFNDTLGHPVGDQILKTMGERLVSCVSSKDLVARIDGDEYGILLRDLESPDVAGVKAHQIIRTIQQPLRVQENEISCGSCIGISLFPNDASTAEKLANYADMALFKAKGAGQNTYFYFAPQMNLEMEERLSLERDMRKALTNHEFFLNYQPQIKMDTGRVIGWEALVRWQHPERGLVPPNMFISVAEDTGLITPLYEFVLHVALDQQKKWEQMGYPGMTMAVNLSSAQFEDKNLVKTIKKMLTLTKVRPDALELELTESLLMKDAQEANKILREISGLGVRIAIDDFGTGYSSLSYLRRFPVDKLKVDRSFVKDMKHLKENAEIVKAIISLGHILGMDVIAEGVENEDQLKLLKELGCDSMQGFFLGKPMSAADATGYLVEKNSK